MCTLQQLQQAGCRLRVTDRLKCLPFWVDHKLVRVLLEGVIEKVLVFRKLYCLENEPADGTQELICATAGCHIGCATLRYCRQLEGTICISSCAYEGLVVQSKGLKALIESNSPVSANSTSASALLLFQARGCRLCRNRGRRAAPGAGVGLCAPATTLLISFRASSWFSASAVPACRAVRSSRKVRARTGRGRGGGRRQGWPRPGARPGRGVQGPHRAGSGRAAGGRGGGSGLARGGRRPGMGRRGGGGGEAGRWERGRAVEWRTARSLSRHSPGRSCCAGRASREVLGWGGHPNSSLFLWCLVPNCEGPVFYVTCNFGRPYPHTSSALACCAMSGLCLVHARPGDLALTRWDFYTIDPRGPRPTAGERRRGEAHLW